VLAIKKPITIAVLDEVVKVVETWNYPQNLARSLGSMNSSHRPCPKIVNHTPRVGSRLLADERGIAEAGDEVNEPLQSIVDGVLQDFLVEVGVLVREHVPHANDLGPVFGCFGLEKVWAHLTDGVDGDFQAMAHSVADQDVVQ
jgi:hypothetical protein